MTEPIVRALRRWWQDRQGAAAVQFIAVLPVFALVIAGLWAFYSVYSARDALCDATQEASKYLQVEGPRFDPDAMPYPDAWRAQARTIIESELKSERWYGLVPVSLDEVVLWPDTQRQAPKDMSEVSIDAARMAMFEVRVTKTITNPLAIFMPNEDGTLRQQISISCQSTGYYEGDPVGPTAGPVPPPNPGCPPVPACTPGPPPPTPTPCRGPNCPTPEPCRPCNPR